MNKFLIGGGSTGGGGGSGGKIKVPLLLMIIKYKI